ncbi:MAG: hypothetical protein H6713_01195 [Myxococcales bacterium]|nr:hypothetical protein [Myxococcales bacterium]MCB9748598.1 hypothetical protein [Myxococcales bacterium]
MSSTTQTLGAALALALSTVSTLACGDGRGPLTTNGATDGASTDGNSGSGSTRGATDVGTTDDVSSTRLSSSGPGSATDDATGAEPTVPELCGDDPLLCCTVCVHEVDECNAFPVPLEVCVEDCLPYGAMITQACADAYVLLNTCRFNTSCEDFGHGVICPEEQSQFEAACDE